MRICIDSNQFVFGIAGAFAEWQKVKYLVSDNRHFLEELHSDVFEVLSPDEFLLRYSQAVLLETDQ